MNGTLTRIISQTNSGFFIKGLGGIAFFYILLIILILINSNNTITKLEERLASQTVEIARTGQTTSPVTRSPEQTISETVTHYGPSVKTQNTDRPRPQHDSRPLAAAPVEGLYEKTDNGLLPEIRGKDGLTAFQAYKKPFAATGKKPVIALLLDDYGLSDKASLQALESLPPEVTFLLSPYSAKSEEWQKKARENGHEVWLNLAFENADLANSDPGSRPLLAGASLKYNQDTLEWNLGRTTGYAGVTGATDFVFGNASALLQPLMKEIYRRGVAYLELNPSAPSVIETLAISSNAPYAKADLIINDGNNEHTGSPLKNLEFIAQGKGYAVGLLKPYPASIEQISTWLGSLESKGYVLVPVSVIAQRGVKPEPKMPNTPDLSNNTQKSSDAH